MPATSSDLPSGTGTGSPCLIVTRRLADASSRPDTEQIVLRAERRLFLKRRWRGRAADGTEFGFDLESRLTDGCVIHRTDDADYIVRQEPEPVYILRPRDAAEAALQGWMIGNLHMGIEILPGEIRAMHDPAVRQLMERQAWEFAESTVLFNPLRVTAHAT